MTKQGENTQIAVMGHDIAQIQKDMSTLVGDVRELRNARYVTQNEMQIAVKNTAEDMNRDFMFLVNNLEQKINSVQRILWLILSTFAIAVIGAIAKTILKL